MYFIVPLGVDEATVKRIPWTSIAIAALCALAFLFTWVLPASPFEEQEKILVEALKYWDERPYLKMPKVLQQELKLGIPVEDLGADEKGADGEAREADDEFGGEDDEEGEGQSEVASGRMARVAEEQEYLNGLVDRYVRAKESSTFRRWSLVPARGLAQPGWLTHMFLHFGWMHIIGNLFFFYLVGPLLEDAWGRWRFAAFYLVGGLGGAIGHYAHGPRSDVMMAGASGAIAACIGAFALRYASRKIRFGYFLFIVGRIKSGTFMLPAWVWGLFWIGFELLDFVLDDGSSNVAMMAHIGGFGVGFGIAAALRVSGLEKRFEAEEDARDTVWSRHPALDEAQAAIDRGDLSAARASFGRVLAEKPQDSSAIEGLARLEFDAGQPEVAMKHVDRLLSNHLQRNDEEAVFAVMGELGGRMELQKLRPPLAYRLAGVMERGGPALTHFAPTLYALVASADSTSLKSKAELRLAQLQPKVSTERAIDLDLPQPDPFAELEPIVLGAEDEIPPEPATKTPAVAPAAPARRAGPRGG